MPFGFKDLMVVDRMPGQPDLIKYQAQKRKRGQYDVTGNTGEAVGDLKKRPQGGTNIVDPIATGKHAKGIGMGWPGIHTIVRDPAMKKHHSHVFQYESSDDVEEALTVAQRRKRAQQMKKYSSRLKIGRKKAMSRMADRKRLQKRAQKAARNFLAKRLTKGIPKAELTPARKQEIEKRLDKMKPRIAQIAKKLMPAVRKKEVARRQSK